MSDLISRQAAIDAINALHDKPNAWLDCAVDAVMALPTEQPDVPDTNVGDIISRYAAIGCVDDQIIVTGEQNAIEIQNYIRRVANRLNDLPSVQPTHPTPSNTLGTLDCINRAKAIKAVKFYETFCDPYPRVIEALEELPSVQPDKDLIHLQKEQAYMQGYEDGQKSRRGKWICQADDDIFNCSECDFEIDATGCIDPMEYLKTYNFCPNCGADMRGSEQE